MIERRGVVCNVNNEQKGSRTKLCTTPQVRGHWAIYWDEMFQMLKQKYSALVYMGGYLVGALGERPPQNLRWGTAHAYVPKYMEKCYGMCWKVRLLKMCEMKECLFVK